MSVVREAWRRVAAAEGLLRRTTRRIGVGRLLQRMGIAHHWRRFAPEENEPPPPTEPRGALLVGHPYGVQAVGEYVRASAAAFSAAGVPFHIRNVLDWGDHLRGTHPDFAFWERVTKDRAYRVNVLHVNANEMEGARRHLGRRFFAGRYNIACWHWELSRFPAAWRPALGGVDELWASSRFLQQALAEKAGIPVLWMPHPVEVRGGGGLARPDLGLPQRTFLFLASFDFNSYVTRKNPLGAVRAFQAAFPAGSAASVGLVVKASGSTERPEDARAFFGAPELGDPRVIAIDAVLDRRRMVALIESCDAYVSLHRSEGFGRGMAEAMLLGRPVIATGYSGNMDFTSAETACVVDYRLVRVGRDEYPHAEGQQWAEPDLDQAAAYMRRLVDEPAWGAALAAKGREVVEAQHGIEAAGRRYRARLEQLGFA